MFSYFRKKKNEGQSLVEILIGLGIGAILIGTASFAITFILRSTTDTQKINTATQVSQDLLDKVRSFSNSNWDILYNLTKGSSTRYIVYPSGTVLAVMAGSEGVMSNELINNLVGLWKFDETAGTIAYDFSKNGNHGSFVGPVIRATSTCKLGYCLLLDNEEVQANVSGTPVLASFTLAGWGKLILPEDGTIVSVRAGGAGSALGANINGKPEAKIINSGNVRLTMTASKTMYDGNWHHLALTFDNTSLKGTLYVDGTVVASGTASSGVTGSTDYVRIGEDTGMAWGNWDGNIDDVYVYNRVLTSDEVYGMWNGGPYNRYFSIENVCRSKDTASAITGESPCNPLVSIEDPITQKVTVTTEWQGNKGIVNMKVVDYLVRWENSVLHQTDWSGGATGTGNGVTIPNSYYGSSTNVTPSNGSIKIEGL